MHGRLALVMEVAESRYGYRAFLVRYLHAPPLPELPEDWVPAPEVRVMMEQGALASIRERIVTRLPVDSPSRQRLMAANPRG